MVQEELLWNVLLWKNAEQMWICNFMIYHLVSRTFGGNDRKKGFKLRWVWYGLFFVKEKLKQNSCIYYHGRPPSTLRCSFKRFVCSHVTQILRENESTRKTIQIPKSHTKKKGLSVFKEKCRCPAVCIWWSLLLSLTNSRSS